MRNYELTFIVEPNIDQEGVTGVVERVSEYITSSDGKVTSVDVWGRRALAYPIRNHREGSYVLLNASILPANINDLERSLKLDEPIIRYMLIVQEDS